MKFFMGSFMFLVLAFLVNHILGTPLCWCIAAILFLFGVWGEVEALRRKRRRYVRSESKKRGSTRTPHHRSSKKSRASHHAHERIMKTETGEDIVSLPVSKTEELHFVKLADIRYEDKDYVIMQRARHLKERGIDDAVVFCVTICENGEKDYAIERNEKTVAAVFALYRKNTES